MTVFAFGPRWESPPTENAEWMNVPVGRTCVACMGLIREGDSGLFVGFHTESVNVAEPIHRECFELAQVSGGAPNVELGCYPEGILTRAILNLTPRSLEALERMVTAEKEERGLDGANHSELINQAIQLLEIFRRGSSGKVVPLEVILAAIDHSLRTTRYEPDANLAFIKLCDQLGVDPGVLRYERGWAKKYID